MKRRGKISTIIFCTVLLVIIISGASLNTSCADEKITSGETNKLSTEVTLQPEDTILQVTSGLLKPLTLDELIALSDAIVIGTVLEILPSQQVVSEAGKADIYTDVLVQVDRYLYGKDESNIIAVRVYNGRVGNTVKVGNEEPVFTVGEETFLVLISLQDEPMLGSENIGASAHYRVCGAVQGKGSYSDGVVKGLRPDNYQEENQDYTVSIDIIEGKILSIKE